MLIEMGVGFTLRLVEQRELRVDGGPWEGGQAQEVLLQQGDVGLLVHSGHVLSEGDEEEHAANLLQFTGKHLEEGHKSLHSGHTLSRLLESRILDRSNTSLGLFGYDSEYLDL